MNEPTTLHIGPELLKAIDRARGFEPRSSFVRRMLRKAMGIEEPKDRA